jgi:hypothetical protein
VEQHQALTKIAKEQGRSLSDLVREIVKRHLLEQDQETWLQQELETISALAQIRKRVQAEHGTVPVDGQNDGLEACRDRVTGSRAARV